MCLGNSHNLAPATVRSHTDRARYFLRWVSECHKDLSLMSVNNADDFIRSKREAGWRLMTLATQCNALRAFFNYAEDRGWCLPAIACGIVSPRLPKYTELPKGPSWAEVRRLIRTVNGKTRAELRARALLLLYSIYGLRSSEVASLRLDDFDWRNETFCVHRAKRGGIQRYPIQYEVGEAILEYLRNGRPRCACRHVFVTMQLPYRPVGPGGMWGIGKRMQRIGIQSEHRGPPSLRHPCATHLLKRGSSLKEIADFLGHRDTRCVEIYAKYDKQSLYKVASFSLAGIR
jgi:integrase/recombinase XerD